MEPEQPTNNQESPAEEKQAPPPPGARDNNRQRPDPRRGGGGRFRRDNRGGRNDRGGGGGGTRPQAPAQGPNQSPRDDSQGNRPPSNIRDAMQHVDHIRTELRNILEEMQEVTRILDQVEKDKSASEDEIEQLRDSLRGLHRDSGAPRYPRNPMPQPQRQATAPREVAPVHDEEPAHEEPSRDEDQH